MAEPEPAVLAGVVGAVREREPVVHCITATVSMAMVADGLLAARARPMMTETQAEAPAMTGLADALLINLGTLSTDGAKGIAPTVARARRLGRPWVLDPTAVGSAPVRTNLAFQLLDGGPAVIRGNASEVLALAGRGGGGKGADAIDRPEEALTSAQRLALEVGCVVAISGAVDIVTDGQRIIRVHNGHPLLARVVGTGCLLGAMVAACACTAEPLTAAVAATAWLTVAADEAASPVGGPGSFRIALLDALDRLTPEEIATRAKLS